MYTIILYSLSVLYARRTSVFHKVMSSYRKSNCILFGVWLRPRLRSSSWPHTLCDATVVTLRTRWNYSRSVNYISSWAVLLPPLWWCRAYYVTKLNGTQLGRVLHQILYRTLKLNTTISDVISVFRKMFCLNQNLTDCDFVDWIILITSKI